MGVVAARPRDHALAGDCLSDHLEELDLLVIAEARGLAGGARHHHAVRPVGDQHRHQLLGGLVVDRSVCFERRDHCGQQASYFGHWPITPISMARSAIWTAFSAAPLRKLSDTSQRINPWLDERSSLMRPTYT